MPRLASLPRTCVAVLTVCACEADDPPPECEFVREVVGLDDSVPAGAGGAVLPREIVTPMSQVITGALEWKADQSMEWVSASPSTGTTTFSSSAAVVGDIIYSRVPEATGNTLLRCAPTLEFDVEIDFETADGVLDEQWDGRAVFHLSSFSGPSVDVDPEAEGIPAKLDVRLAASPPQPLLNVRYELRLLYVPNTEEPKLEGNITVLGDFETERDGEIINEGGIFVDLASWSNIE